MGKRKASLDSEETPKKRRRQIVEGVNNEKPTLPPASFDSLNNDCLVNVFTRLQNDDMNNLAMCSRACREARSNESLDQTRTGAIRCSKKTATVRSICNAIVRGEWSVFGVNRTHIKIVDVPNIRSWSAHAVATFPEARLEGVVSLDLSCSADAADQTSPHSISIYALPKPQRD